MKKKNNNHRIIVAENRLTQEQVFFESKPEYIIWFLKETGYGIFDFFDEYLNYLFTMNSEMQLLNFDKKEIGFLMEVMNCGGIEPEDIPYIECLKVDEITKDLFVYFMQKSDECSHYLTCKFQDVITRKTDDFTITFKKNCDKIGRNVLIAFEITYPDGVNVPDNSVHYFSFNGIRFKVTIHSMDKQTVLDFDLE